MTWQVVVRVTGAIAATACLLAMYDALYMYNRSLTNAELNRPRGEVIEPSRGELEALARKLGKSGSLWPHACKPDGLLMQLAMRIGIGSQSACDAYKQWKVPSVVEFRLWDAVEESKGSPFEDAEDCPGNNFAFSHNPTGQSSATIGYTDYVRIVVLYRYGGLWVDGDVIMLRDMRPLLQREFAYQWGSTQNINTAIFHLKKGSKLSEALAQESARNQCRFHPFEVRQYVVNAGLQDELLVYPAAFFDPLWLLVIEQSLDNSYTRILGNLPLARAPRAVLSQSYELFLDSRHLGGTDKFTIPPGDPDVLEEFFPGAFTYHWHRDGVVSNTFGSHYPPHYYSFFKRLLRHFKKCNDKM